LGRAKRLWYGSPLRRTEIATAKISRPAAIYDNRSFFQKLSTGRKVSDDKLAKVNLFHADFHGEDWNYVIKPKV